MRILGGIRKAFALPVVLTTSLVMMLLLLLVLSGVTASGVLLKDQYVQRIARDAAESGINVLMACIKADQTPGGTFYTETTNTCANTAAGAAKYILDTTSNNGYKMKSRFSIPTPTLTSNGVYEFTSTGYVDVYRSNGTTVSSTVQQDTRYRYKYAEGLIAKSASGDRAVCAIINNQTKCWGWNGDGRLGNGTIDTTTEPYERDKLDTTPTSSSGALQLYTVAEKPVLTRVVRPGDKLPDGITSAPNQSNSKLLAKDTDVAVGNGFVCAITTSLTDPVNNTTDNQHTDRRVMCWGDQTNGQLGNGSIATVYIPYAIYTSGGVATPQRWADAPTYVPTAQFPEIVIAGSSHGCMLAKKTSADTSSGNVWCWGSNSKGQIGQNTTTARYANPVMVTTTTGAGNPNGIKLDDISTAAQGGHTCGIQTADYRVVCWGENTFGQIGDQTNTNAIKPTLVQLENATAQDFYGRQLTLGDQYTCGVGRANAASPAIVDGHIYCWGSHQYGEIGSGAAVTTSVTYARRAREITTLQNVNGSATYTNYKVVNMTQPGSTKLVTTLAGSSRGICALVDIDTDGNSTLDQRSVVCWGYNSNGQMGIGDPGSSYTTPVNYTVLSNYTRPTVVPFYQDKVINQIAGGGYRQCAVVAQSKNYCAGNNGSAQIGTGEIPVGSRITFPTEASFLKQNFGTKF